jgi:hypothetical protein
LVDTWLSVTGQARSKQLDGHHVLSPPNLWRDLVVPPRHVVTAAYPWVAVLMQCRWPVCQPYRLASCLRADRGEAAQSPGCPVGPRGRSEAFATLTRVSRGTAHGTNAGWHTACRCTQCRAAHAETQKAFGRARAQTRLPVEVRQQLLGAIHAGQPFRTTLRDLGLTPNRVWDSPGPTQSGQQHWRPL